ncbi:MAG: methyltransferase domain-containing protein [Chloroflexota bacterium]
MKHTSHLYLIQTQPGFEAIAAQEIQARLQSITIKSTHTLPGKNGMVLFRYTGNPQNLLQLRTVEDVFFVLSTLPDLPHTYSALHTLRDTANRIRMDTALALARQFMPGRGGRGKLRFRVVARQAGRTNYRRVDAQRAIEKGITAREDHRWQSAEEKALEFWLTLLPEQALLKLRLSDAQMRHRDEKLQHLPASLRPSAAAALVWLTRPQPDDVFLDPMCGAGTLLIERAQTERYTLLLGGDNSAEAIATTQTNIGPRYKPIEIREWDACALPLDDASVTAAAVNLPFGKQIGSADDNRSLYPALLQEMARVLQPRGRFVVLTSDTRTFDMALKRTRDFTRHETHNVQVLGQHARVFVLERN